jgi:hypothetical protein
MSFQDALTHIRREVIDLTTGWNTTGDSKPSRISPAPTSPAPWPPAGVSPYYSDDSVCICREVLL